MKKIHQIATTSASLFCLALTLFAYSTGDQSFSSMDQAELSQALGGACYTCRSEDYCDARTECKKTGSYWTELVFTGITQKFCYDMHDENSTMHGLGRKGCTADTYKVCVKVRLCAGPGCTNCGDESTESKTTKCNFSGGVCIVIEPIDAGGFEPVGM